MPSNDRSILALGNRVQDPPLWVPTLVGWVKDVTKAIYKGDLSSLRVKGEEGDTHHIRGNATAYNDISHVDMVN